MSPNHSADQSMRTMNNQKRHEGGRTLPRLPQDRINTSMNYTRSTGLGKTFGIGVRCVFASLFVCTIPIYAADAPFNSASISGLGARNIGSAAMSGRISSIAGVHEPSGKITLFVGAASGGVWKSDDSGTRYHPIFDEQPVQSIGALALDPKNSKNVWVGTGESLHNAPGTATNTVSLFLGSTVIRPMRSDFSKPARDHDSPPSVDL